MPKLDNWKLGVNSNDAAPEFRCAQLQGVITGHPTISDGKLVVINKIVAVDDGQIITRSGHAYDLGEPHPDYEQQFPNARIRLLRQFSPEELSTNPD